MRRFLKRLRLPVGTKCAILTTEMAPQPDRKTGRIPTEEEQARWQRVRPIMNELLQGAGLVKVAEDKVLVTGLKGPLEGGRQHKVAAFAARIPLEVPGADHGPRRRGPSTLPVNGGAMPAVDELQLRGKIAQVLDRWPWAGLAVGVVRDGSLAWFHGHGLADVAVEDADHARTRSFASASITKTFTASRGDAAVGAGAGGPRRAGKRLPSHLPAGPGEGELSAGDRATPPHPYRRSRLLAAAVGSASAGRRFGRPGGTIGRAAACRLLPAGACRWRSSRGRSGCTATTGSPRSGRSSRT